jgi:hypothetical protein
MRDIDVATLTLISSLVAMTFVMMVVAILNYRDARRDRATRPVRPVDLLHKRLRSFACYAGVDRKTVCRQPRLKVNIRRAIHSDPPR